MIKERLRIGMVVKTNKGIVGMIVGIKENENVYLNKGHYHTCKMMYPSKTFPEIRELVLCLGADQDAIEKDQIVEIITQKYCYERIKLSK
jgi:hypothetical protein